MIRYTAPHRRHRLAICCALVTSAVVGVAASTGTTAYAEQPTLSHPDDHPYRHQPSTALQEAVDHVVDGGSPGALLLLRQGQRTTVLTSGLSNLAPASPMRADLRARIGGLTKTLTASVVLQLVDEGRLTLADTVEQRLPGVIIPNGAGITIRNLLNHTSGLYDYARDPNVLAPYLAGDLTHIFDPLDGVKVAAQHEPLFEPGTGLAYSNTNYLLLAMVVEKVTGHPFAWELRHRIIQPLGLEHTSYPMTSEIGGPHVHGYLAVDGAPFDVTAWSPTVYGAAGAVLSDAHDVARLYRAVLRGRLINQTELDAMMKIDPVATGGVPDSGISGGGWGLGLLREEFPCGEAWGHDSEIPGYITAAWNSADGDRQVVVIVNTFDDHDEPVSRATRELLVTAYCGED
jgi:D-alanyl-D-alanine carboxypeptidase